MTTTDTNAVPDFDLALVDARDEMSLNIKHPKTGDPLGWVWTFFGPAHPETVKLSNSVSREVLREQRDQRQAQLNGKKVQVEEQSMDELRDKNIGSMVARTKGFTPIKLNGELIEFSADKARELLSDRRKGWLLNQVSEFLRDDASFIQPSAPS